jgi:hypothetical protein
MGKQIGQSGNSATSPPAPAIRRARASSRSNPRAEDNLRAAFRKHDRSRLAYSTTRAGDDDDLAFDSRHEVFTFCFLFSQLGTL